MKSIAKGHIRRLHSVEVDTDGRVHPIHDVSPVVCARVERFGFSVVEDDVRETWGVFNYLIKSGGSYYLAAIY